MNDKEKLEIKKEIFEDLLNCFSFDFTSIRDVITRNQIEDKIYKYKQELYDIEKIEKGE